MKHDMKHKAKRSFIVDYLDMILVLKTRPTVIALFMLTYLLKGSEYL